MLLLNVEREKTDELDRDTIFPSEARSIGIFPSSKLVVITRERVFAKNVHGPNT